MSAAPLKFTIEDIKAGEPTVNKRIYSAEVLQGLSDGAQEAIEEKTLLVYRTEPMMTGSPNLKDAAGIVAAMSFDGEHLQVYVAPFTAKDREILRTSAGILPNTEAEIDQRDDGTQVVKKGKITGFFLARPE